MNILKYAAVLFIVPSMFILPYSAYAEAKDPNKASSQYALHIATDHGIVISMPAGIHCGTDCSYTFANNTAVSLTASANPGCTFIGWSEGSCGDKEICTVTMTRKKTVTAIFSRNMYNLAVTLPSVNTGSGYISNATSDISCGSDCSEAYTHGTPVTLTAVADSGSTFLGWTGDCAGISTCMVTMDAVKNVSAIFAMNYAAVLAGDVKSGLP